MHQGSIVSALLFLLAGCAPIPTVPTPSSSQRDATSPTLRLGSAGLKKDFLLTQASTAPEQRRAKRAAEVLLVATAQDPETGIKSITFDITQSVICGGRAQNQTFSVTDTASPNTGSLPTQMTKSFTVPALRLRCGNVPSSMTVSVTASTENGVGQTTTLPAGRVSSYGPDVLRVATFNLYAPKNHSDDTYKRWGRELGSKVDVLMLEEVLDQRRAELVAHAAGLPHVLKMSNGDVAVASRTPLYNVQMRTIDVPGRLTSSDSHILSVQTNIEGAPHQFIAAHWSIRDGDTDADQRPAHVSSPFRLQAAQAMAALVSSSGIPVFAGGDFNAFSGVGRQDHDDNDNTPDFVGSTTEVDFILTKFTDPFIALGVSDFCSNKRIDYVLMAKPSSYYPVSSETCPFFTPALPSDHPFVLATFEAGDF
jgi:hypothetical protein